MFIFLGTFIYLNIGTFLTEKYISDAVTNHKSWLQPLKINDNFKAYNIGFNFKKNEVYQTIETIKKHQTANYYTHVVIWPFYWGKYTLSQWIIITIEFIFFGGLVKFILVKTGLMVVIISSLILLAIALIRYYKKKSTGTASMQ